MPYLYVHALSFAPIDARDSGVDGRDLAQRQIAATHFAGDLGVRRR